MRKAGSIQLRQVLRESGILVVPCAYDCISARIIEEVGFSALMHGGYNSAASLLGLPDVGLITMTESVTHARNIAAAVNIPVICDADTGFGNPVNVMRTTREFIRGGLAGMYIEDQVEPKRCPGLGGGMIIPTEEMIRKLKSVFEVRQNEDPDFFVIARTHASRAIGIDEAVKRGIAYAQEGADAIFIDLGYSDKAIQEIEVFVDEVGSHAPIMVTMAETVGRPLLSAKELEEMGVKIVLYAMTGMMTAAGALKSVFTELRENGTTKSMVDRMMPFKEIGRLMGMETIAEFERSLGITAPSSPADGRSSS